MEELCRIMEDERAAVTDCMYGALADLQFGNDLLTGDRFERMRRHFQRYERALAALAAEQDQEQEHEA